MSRQELGKWDGSAFTQRAHTLPLFCSGIAHITAAAICSRHARAGAIALHACVRNCADVSEKKLAAAKAAAVVAAAAFVVYLLLLATAARTVVMHKKMHKRSFQTE